MPNLRAMQMEKRFLSSIWMGTKLKTQIVWVRWALPA